MNVKAPRNEHLHESFCKDEVDPGVQLKKIVLGIFSNSKLYEDWKGK